MKKSDNKKSTNKLTIRLFINHALRYKRYSITLLFTVLATVVVMGNIEPYIQAQILDKISNGQYDTKDLWGSFNRELISYAIAVIMTAIVGWRINIWLIWKLEMRVLRDITQRAFDHMISLDANFHANRFGGSLVSQTN